MIAEQKRRKRLEERRSAARQSPPDQLRCTEMCSGSEAGSYLRRIDVVYHSILGLRVVKKKKKEAMVAEQKRRERLEERRSAARAPETIT